MSICAIDFGTTNSTAGILHNGQPQLVNLGTHSPTTRTVLFVDDYDGQIHVGDDAMHRLREGAEGRFMQSLKRYLGEADPINTRVLRYTYSLEDLLAIILRRFRQQAEEVAGQPLDSVILGRPVHFNDDDPTLDRQAEARLAHAAREAGFQHVDFELEPVAAARAYASRTNRAETIMVVDIGGGTTDFTIMRLDPTHHRHEVLANHGIYVGGDMFDGSITRHELGPLLGANSTYTIEGDALPWPRYIFANMGNWSHFNQLLDPAVRRDIKQMHATSNDPAASGRLLELLEDSLYFAFAGAVEGAKCRLSEVLETDVDLSFFSTPATPRLTRQRFEAITQPLVAQIMAALAETLAQANLSADRVDHVFLTGGTTMLPAIRQALKGTFSAEKLTQTDVFTSVGYGLAIAASQLDR